MIIIDRRKEYQTKELKRRMQVEGFYNFIKASALHLKRYENGLMFQSKLKTKSPAK